MIPRLSTLALILLVAICMWANFPGSIPVKFMVKNVKVDTKFEALSLNINIFGKNVSKKLETKYGLDLKGGSHLLYEVDMSKIKNEDKETAHTAARNIIERRVNFFGVSEPTIQTVRSGDSYRISADLPGIQNIEEATKLIGQTAQLEFKEEASVSAEIATQSPVFMRLTKPTELQGKHVTKAQVQFDQTTGKPIVQLDFNPEGSELFKQITGRNVGKQVAIYLDQEIISAPTVQQEIAGGNAIISGEFSLEEAKSLAVAINSGALPVPINLIEQRNIGPTLGQEAVNSSIVAGLIGLTSVILFMVVYYGKMGLISAVGLAIYTLLSLTIFRFIPVVLTLPGVAGFILSIGMAVDSNILIFERIKEETRKGRDLPSAVRLGFGRAIDAIKDANIATLMVAFILFNPFNWSFFPQFGLIRGFALTLAIGVASSLFTGVVVTRRLIDIVLRTAPMKIRKAVRTKS